MVLWARCRGRRPAWRCVTVDRGRLRTLEALRIDGSTPESKSCIAFCMVASASRELNLGSDILICTINFQFGCNLAGEEEGRVQTRMARLGGWLASWGATLPAESLAAMWRRCGGVNTRVNFFL